MFKKMESEDLTDKSIEVVRGPHILNWAAIMLTTVPQVSLAIILQKLGKKEYGNKTGEICVQKQGFECHKLSITNANIETKKKSFRRSSYLPTSPSFPLSSFLGEYHVFQEAVGTAFWLKIMFLHFEICALSNIHYLHKNRWKSAYTVVRNTRGRTESEAQKKVQPETSCPGDA